MARLFYIPQIQAEVYALEKLLGFYVSISTAIGYHGLQVPLKMSSTI